MTYFSIKHAIVPPAYPFSILFLSHIWNWKKIFSVLFNTVIFGMLLYGWTITQDYLATSYTANNCELDNTCLQVNPSGNNCVIDLVHDSNMINSINMFLHMNNNATIYLFIGTSLLLDLGFIYIFLQTVIYNKYKLLFIMFSGFLLRQICQMTNKLPIPDKMLWINPGFTSLVVTYDTTNDFFFSGHTFMALLVGIDVFNNYGFKCKILSCLFMFLEIGFIIVTKSHYMMDIYAAVLTYGFLHLFAKNISILN
jgi:hypothetical protein